MQSLGRCFPAHDILGQRLGMWERRRNRSQVPESGCQFLHVAHHFQALFECISKAEDRLIFDIIRPVHIPDLRGIIQMAF